MSDWNTRTTSPPRPAVTQPEMQPRPWQRALFTLASCLVFPAASAAAAAPPTLMTVNLEDAVQTARLTLSTKLASLEKLFENQPAPTLSVDGRTFEDRFEPFEVHVYRLKR
jgi:hypothetical protein